MSNATLDPATPPAVAPVAAVPATSAVPPPAVAPVAPAAAVTAPVATPAPVAAGTPSLPEYVSPLGKALAAPVAAAVPDPVYQLKAPEGVEKSVADVLLQRAEAFAKQYKVTPEAAQALVGHQLDYRKQIHDQAKAHVAAERDTYEQQAKADPEIGGHKYDETLRLAARALEEHGAPKGLRDLLSTTSAGAHPEVLRFLASLGRKSLEGAPVNAGKAPPKAAHPSQLFFTTPPKSP